MSEVAVQHGMAEFTSRPCSAPTPRKLGCGCSCSPTRLTFGALLFAYSYGRISNPDWPTPFGKESITNATIMTGCLLSSSLTMVLAVLAARRGDRSWTRNWILFTMFFGIAFIVLHGMEWTHLIDEGMTPFKNPWSRKRAPVRRHLLHPDRHAHAARHYRRDLSRRGFAAQEIFTHPAGYLAAAWWLIPADSVFHYGVHVLLAGFVVAAMILFLKPKDYDAHDVEIAGLYWHFVDLVWMFIFPLVYLMSTRV